MILIIAFVFLSLAYLYFGIKASIQCIKELNDNNR